MRINMKTRNLVSMSMMAALLAACSNELEMPGVIDNSNDANRPTAGKLVVIPNVVEGEEDASTRAQWNRGWIFEEGDNFGAMLMDTWNGTNEGNTIVRDYTFTDYVHTNYEYIAGEGGKVWTNKEGESALAGNYFFHYPFNANIKERGYIRYTLPNEQTNYDEDKKEVYWDFAQYKNQKYMGYAFVPAAKTDINQVNVDFYPIFATPRFELRNMSGLPIRLVKLIIRAHQERPDAVPALLPTTVAVAPLSGNFKEVAAQYPAMEQKEQIASLFSHSTVLLDGSFAQTTKIQSKSLEAKKDEGVYEYSLTFGEDYIVPNGEPFKASIVMPAGEYGDFDIFAIVELQNSAKNMGVVSWISTKEKDMWKGFGTQSGSMQTVLKPGIVQQFTGTFTPDGVMNLGFQDFTVTNSEDLLKILNMKAKDGGFDLLTIKTLGEEVELNQEIYNWLTNVQYEGIRLQIDGKIVIPEGLTYANAEGAIDQLYTDGRVNTIIINKAEETLTKDLVAEVWNYGTLKGDVTITGGVHNAEKAELNITTIKGDVENGGDITVKTIEGTLYNGWNATVETVKGDVYNYDNGGKLVINNVTDKLDNTGLVTIMEGSINEVVSGQTISNSTIDVIEETTITKFDNGRWGKMNITADTELGGKNLGIINITDATVTPNSTNDLFNFINLDGSIVGVINVTNADLKYTDNTKTIQNEGIINVIEASHVAVTGGYGIIDITKADKEGGYQASSVDTENQYYRYCGAVKVEDLKNLIASDNYGKNPVILEFNKKEDGSAATFVQDAVLDGAKVRKILVHKGVTLTLSGNFWLADDGMVYPSDPIEALGDSYKALEVEEGAVLQVINGTTLTAKDSFTATIDGKFRVENTGSVTTAQGKIVTITGDGVVEASKVNFKWTKDSTFSGDWTVK